MSIAEAELRTAWTRQLLEFWSLYNDDYLGRALRPPLLRLNQAQQVLGSWCAETRQLSLSLRHVGSDPWHEVLHTLRHEMAHQYVDEVLRVSGETPHGEAFRHACERLRVTPRASGGEAPEVSDCTERLARRVAKLLALGASPNRNEAEAAVRKARRLMVERNVELVRDDGERNFGSAALGPVKARHAAWETVLGSILAEFFFVEAIWSWSYDASSDKRGTVLQVYGTPENLQMAGYVHGYLCSVMESLWRDYRSHQGRGSRMAYFRGLLQGFRDKLREQQREIDAEGALVWSGDPRLRTFYRWHNPRVATRRVGGDTGSPAYGDGRRDGRSIELRRPIATDGEQGDVRRLGDG